MKQMIREQIQQAIAKLYPQHKDIGFSVDYASHVIPADFASNAALVLAKNKPFETAQGFT